MVKVPSFCDIEFFSTLAMGAFLYTLLQFYTKWTLMIGYFTKFNIFGLFSENLLLATNHTNESLQIKVGGILKTF